jgi:hypothetical protein
MKTIILRIALALLMLAAYVRRRRWLPQMVCQPRPAGLPRARHSSVR